MTQTTSARVEHSLVHTPFDTLEAEAFSPLGGSPLVWVTAGHRDAARLSVDTRAIVIGTDRAGNLPPADPTSYDCLLTTAADAPVPWVSVVPKQWDAHRASLAARAARTPVAAATLARVLKIAEALPFDLALAAESHAYSMLLAGGEFADWRARNHAPTSPQQALPSPIRISRECDVVRMTLAQPANRNAFTAAMRDALFDALAALLDDPTAPTLTLDGDGACFSIGGDLAEFGSMVDVALADAIRTERSCARLLGRLGARATAVLHGACIGSGVEIPAAAGHRVARAGTWFQLPELGMGLIPGAGGCVTIPRTVGRHRAAWMVLGGRRVAATTAWRWGLIDRILP